jgi:hypothetical protein
MIRKIVSVRSIGLAIATTGLTVLLTVPAMAGAPETLPGSATGLLAVARS